MKKLLLLFALCTSLGAWAQEIDKADTSDEVGAEIRRLEVILSGNWLDGSDVEEKTTMLIDLIMGYENGAFVDGKAFTHVTIKSAEGTTVTVNQSLLRQLVSGKAGDGFPNGFAGADNHVKYLDLRDIAVTHYVGHDGAASTNENATFYAGLGGNVPTEFLAMPSFDTTVADQTYSIPPYTVAWMSLLDEVILPSNAKTVEHEAFAGVNVATVKLNVGLEFIGNSAFYASSQIDKETTLDVPSSVKYIGPGAFNFRNFSDIYFHSAQAPICPVGKVFADSNGGEAPFLLFGNYTGWGGISYTKDREDGGDDYKTTGVANRMNYKNGDSYWFTMLHFPASADVPNLDISSYKDETRVYDKIYGSVYYDVNDDKGKLETGVPGKEQEYIAREKVWAFQGAYDFVGQETEVMSFDGQTTGLAPSGFAAIPAEAVGKGVVDSGFEDTYRGLNYIWPCQTQYNRAYVTVANGYNWDGVTKYRPELTDEQIALMVKDGLTVKVGGTGDWVVVGSDIVYTQADADAYNAKLPNAVKAGDPKEKWTADGAIAHNAELEGHVEAGQSAGSYTAEEAIEYNASLPTAIHEGDVKEKWTAEDAKVNNESLTGAWHENDPIHPTAEEIIEHNADFDGAVWVGLQQTPEITPEYYTRDEYVNSHEGYSWLSTEQYNGLVESAIANAKNSVAEYAKTTSDKGVYDYTFYTYEEYVAKTGYTWMDNATYNTNLNNAISNADAAIAGYLKRVPSKEVLYTEETAAAYNAEHNPNPWTESTVIGYITEEDALTHNATLPNAVKADDTKSTYTAAEALAHNSNPETNPGAVAENDSKGDYTAETAAAFNATLPGAVKEGDTKVAYTAEAAAEYNATLEGHREAEFKENTLDNAEMQDYLSMIAFQSTRRIVFSDNAGGGDNYKVNIPSSQEWWTICLPFDLTKAQIDKFFGVGTHVCKFSKVERKIKNLNAGEKPYVKFYFTDDQYVRNAGTADDSNYVPKNADDVVLEAHEAYMIFPTINEEDAVYLAQGIPMSEYTTKPGSPTPTVINSIPAGDDSQEYRFIGNYDTKLPSSEIDPETGKNVIKDVVVPQYSYIYAKKANATGKHPYQFWFTQNAGIKWGPNKCIIQSTDADRGLNDNKTFFAEKEKGGEVKQITIFGYDDEDAASGETAIEEVIYVLGSGEDQQVIYSVNGMKLNDAPNKGVYIKGGKKFLAK